MFRPIFSTCTECKTSFTTQVTESGLLAYKAGEPVQRAFPELSTEARELFFISNICGTCWDEMFADAE